MKRSRNRWWLIYAACAITVVSALCWISATFLSLEREQTEARGEADHQAALRLALWRMDSWLLPILSREAARPYFEYLSYYPQDRSYARLMRAIEVGESLTPSPLLNFHSDFIRLHFQLDASGELTSPQAPRGSLEKLAVSACLPPGVVSASVYQLAHVRELVRFDQIMALIDAAEARAASTAGATVAGHDLPAVTMPPSNEDLAQAQNRNELNARARTNYQTQKAAQTATESQLLEQTAFTDDAPVTLSQLVPTWLGQSELFCFRSVRVGPTTLVQGILFDWPALRKTLLGETRDLVSEATLEPLDASDAHASASGLTLAAIPARLAAPPRRVPVLALTPARVTLAIAWLAVLISLGAAFITLRSSIALGEKRSRFASAVTHELRTPLTTFRMYSEMLADGMVPGGAQRQTYLETLKNESGRLAALVENVLAYARLEDGRAPMRPQPIALNDLFDRVLPSLDRRAADAGLALAVSESVRQPTTVLVDGDAVAQILFNLVDNACKYARNGAQPIIELACTRLDRAVLLRVRDHGPGISGTAAARIFEPFERADRNGDPTPGVGLGLALARSLARDLGGDLTFTPAPGGGASFELRLPKV